MADNNTFVLFEEIKNKLEIIYKEVRELKEKDISSVSLPTSTAPAQSNEQQDQELLKQYELRTKEILNKYIAIQMRIKDEEAKSIDKLVASVLTMLYEWKEQKKKPQPQEHIHKHSFDIKSSKVFTYVVITAVVCLASLVGNFWLWQSKQQYKDDALKFRIIRNENTITNIKKKADGYDLGLKQKADSLMQRKLK